MSSCLFITKRRKCGEVGITWYAYGHETSIWKNVFIIFNKLSCIGRFHMQFVKSTILSPNHKEVAFMFPCKCVHTLSQKDFAHSSWLMFATCYYMDIYGINFVISIFQIVLLFRITAREMVIVSDMFAHVCLTRTTVPGKVCGSFVILNAREFYCSVTMNKPPCYMLWDC